MDIFFRIFVVEDDLIYMCMFWYFLEFNFDYEVYVFDMGVVCLDKLNFNFHFIFFDYFLFDMMGEEVFECIKYYDQNILVVILFG